KFLRGIAQGLSKMSPAPAGRQRPICPEIRWPHVLCISRAGRGAIAARGEALYGVRVGLAAPERIGPVAQWLEPTAHNGLVGGSNPPGPTTHSRFLPTCGDAPKMPTNGGLFQCVFRVSQSPGGHTADFGPPSLREKIPFLAPKRCGGESFAPRPWLDRGSKIAGQTDRFHQCVERIYYPIATTTRC